MKVRIEMFPNPDCACMHLDQRVTDSTIVTFMGKDWQLKKQPKFVKKLFLIDGVEDITLQQHSITIKKGKLFDFGEILRQAIEIIKNDLSLDGEIKEDGDIMAELYSDEQEEEE